ncbi:MAG: alpha-L-fucosidase, partial [Victivallales bacterium]|nr:alpha-L-fucosidase [Victivallales bacterium]
NPIHFNANEWISAAAQAGVRYIVFTTKHHDGFAMYHTRVSDYNIYDATPFKRDPLAELAAACEKYDVKLGVYYSHNLDWHEPNGGDPGPQWHKNVGGMSWGNDWDFPDFEHKNFDQYFYDKCLPQLREIFTNYGRINTLWCDCPQQMTKKYSQEVYDLVTGLQPWCLINSRIGNDLGDYGSMGDNKLPEGYLDFPAESPVTLNDTWGFKIKDTNWKTPETVANQLAMLASRNTNYLLNVGPQPDGRLPQAAMDVFAKLAPWMKTVTNAVHDCKPNPLKTEVPFGYCTAHDNQLNVFVRDWAEQLVIQDVPSQVISASVPFKQDGSTLTLMPGPRPDSLLPLITVKFQNNL